MLVRGRETREGLMLDDTANPIELDTEKGFISSLGAFRCPEYARPIRRTAICKRSPRSCGSMAKPKRQ
jgi:hypothetical protein